MTRRPDGALEKSILEVLWRSDRPLQPGEVNDQLDTGLAYTSVATVLTRLHRKGLVAREAHGRAFAYSPAVDESELAAQRIGDLLALASDRSKVLANFVDSLSARDAKLLRSLLEGDQQ
jgi:predicted transcriptional regulator